MNKNKRGKLLIILGLALVIAATAIYSVYDCQDKTAGKNSKMLLDELRQEQNSSAEFLPENTADEMAGANVAGYNLIGTIMIPSVGTQLPVQHDWSYDLLKISPCRYSGTAEGRNLIILGHNYKAHFTPIKKVTVGSAVEFVSINGKSYRYTVKETEILHKTELDKLTSSDYDLSVFTCTTGGESRFVLRCELNEEQFE